MCELSGLRGFSRRSARMMVGRLAAIALDHDLSARRREFSHFGTNSVLAAKRKHHFCSVGKRELQLFVFLASNSD